jgi:hypothetical protein
MRLVHSGLGQHLLVVGALRALVWTALPDGLIDFLGLPLPGN